MSEINTSKELAIVAEQAPLPTVQTPKIVSALRRRTIFDLTNDELDRLQFMSKMYAASSFNSGKIRLQEGDFLLVMLKGLEVGINPMAAVDTINIIHGKPTLDAKGMLALVKSSGLLENIHIDSTAERCIITIKRVGNDEQIVSFTIQDARTFKTTEWVNGTKQNISLADKHNWKSQPEIMLKWRAITKAMREVFPDILSGLYTQEELAPNTTIVSEDGSMSLLNEPETSNFATPKTLDEEAIAKLITWAIEKGYGNNADHLLALLNKEDWSFTNGDGKVACEKIAAAHTAFVQKIIKWSSEKEYGSNEPELLKLLDAKNWMFANGDGRQACKAVEAAHNKLLEELNQQSAETSNGASEDEDSTDEEPVTLSKESFKEIEAWVWQKFNIELNEAIEKLPDGDLSRFSTVEAACKYITQEARKSMWSAVTNSCKYVANSKYILFETETGFMRFYSRTEFADTIGEEYATTNKILELPDGTSVNIDPIMLTGEHKGTGNNSYIIVTKAEIIIPF